MKIKLNLIGLLCVSLFAAVAQDNGNHLIKKSTKETSYSYQKKNNGVTVFYFTNEQFNKLPEQRKAYFQQHKECFQIINSKNKSK